jgi:hypothetical protein
MRRIILLGLVVSVLAIGLRLPLLAAPSPVDWLGTENEHVATALMRGGGWSDAFGQATGATAHVAPLYPLLLAGLYRLFDTYETPAGRLAQQLLSLAITTSVLLLLPALARKLRLGVAVGWAAALVGACLSANRVNEVGGHHEQGVAALLLIGLVWGCAHLRQRGWSCRWSTVGMGVLLGVAALSCPNLLLVPLLFGLACLLFHPEERVGILRCGAALAAITLTFVGPWIVRNYLVLGGFVPVRSNFGLELAVGNNPLATGYTYAPGFDDMHPYGSPDERGRLRRLGELAYMKEKQRQALAWITSHWRRFAWLTGRRIWLFWFSFDESWYRPDGRLRLQGRSQGLIGLGLFLELLRLVRKRHPAGLLLACTIVAMGLPYFVTHVEPRYRLPIFGVSVLAACDFVFAAAHWTAHRLPRRWSILVSS